MAKYSKEQRRCAVELYVRYECCVCFSKLASAL
jgi:hypothetical protein